MVMSAARLVIHDMRGCLIESMSLTGYEGWLLRCYKVMPRYRVSEAGYNHIMGFHINITCQSMPNFKEYQISSQEYFYETC